MHAYKGLGPFCGLPENLVTVMHVASSRALVLRCIEGGASAPKHVGVFKTCFRITIIFLHLLVDVTDFKNNSWND